MSQLNYYKQRALLTGVFWLVVVLVLFTLSNPALYDLPFRTGHAWASAHFATIARSFSEYGVLALNGIPIQNNGFLDGRPDVYLNWPPLFPILLSQVFSYFGPTEDAAYWMMFVVHLINALLLLLVGLRLSGLESGLFSAIAWFTLPINIKFGYLVLHLNFALAPVLLALLFLVRYIQRVGSDGGNLVLGCSAVAAAVMTTWEPVLMLVGLCSTAWLTKTERLLRPVTYYAITGAATACGILIWYGLSFPEMAKRIFQAALFRAGLTGLEIQLGDIYSLMETTEDLLSVRRQVMLFIERLGLLGMLGMIAVAALWLDTVFRPREERDFAVWFTTVGLTSFWLLWAIVFRQHYTVHNYELLLAAPLTALASGLLIAQLLRHVYGLQPDYQRRVALLVLLGAVPAVMAFELSQGARHMVADGAAMPPSHEVRYGLAIRAHTAPGDVVIATSPGMVPVYYSKRHVIRINNEPLLKHALPDIEARAGTRAIYLALEPDYVAAFPDTMQELIPVFKDRDLVLLALKQRAPAQSTE